LLIAALGRSKPPLRAAEAAPGGSTAGQFVLLNKDGQPAGECPLQHTDVTADIAGYVARVTVKQQFQNTASDPVEAVYTFPLPEDAAVDDMTMTLGNRIIRGEIKRREEARQIYEAARDAGQSAALLDQERPNIFTQSVANLMPGEPVTVTISYVRLLKYDEGGYTFSFPMVVGPRYTPTGGYSVPGKRGDPSASPSFSAPAAPSNDPGERLSPLLDPMPKVAPGGPQGDPMPKIAPRGSAPNPAPKDSIPRVVPPGFYPPVSSGPQAVVTDADKITPPIALPGTRAGHDISLRVNLDAGLPIQDVRSELHPISISRDGPTRAVINLENEATLPNKDFILHYSVAGSQMQSGALVTANGDGTGYFTLILQPPAAPPASEISPKEMVFVIDQTGSQSGWPIEKAKETMRYAIRHLNPGDTFQLIGFNTDVYPCFPAPVPNTPANVTKALQFLDPIQGSGGTDILKSVDYALKLPDDPGRLRIICYMTDGYVGNDMQILDYIRKNRGRARMFPFGIGNSVNRFLIEGMAKEGRGAAEYVTLDTPGSGPAEKFYRRISSPLLLDPQVNWGSLPVSEIYPSRLPDVFSAGPVIVKGRYTRPGEGDIVVQGRLRGQPWSRRVHLVLPRVHPEGSEIGTLWAREKIEDLQSQDWSGAQSGQPDPSIKDKIVSVALEHRLMSQYTSFVAVERRTINLNGKPRKVDVPVEMPEGVSYDGIFGGRDGEKDVMLRSRALSFGALGRAAYSAPALSKSVSAGAMPTLLSAKPAAQSPAALEEREALSDINSLSAGKNAVNGRQESVMASGNDRREDRRPPLVQEKLDPALQALLAKAKAEASKNGSKAKKAESVPVQIWLSSLPKDGLKKLKAIGFKLGATLRPGRLLIGTLPADRLEKLVGLDFVRRAERPNLE
jgi:Ca-activated chloride channel family protein